MKYTALTIGPIIYSLNKAHKKREIWAASFLFSRLMERIIEALLNNGVEKEQFVLPYPKSREFDTPNEYKSAGIFPDRLILESENGLFNELQNAVNSAKKEFEQDFDKCKDFFDRYLRTNIVEKELNGNANVIFEMNSLLANTELQTTLIAEDKLCFETFLQNISKKKIYKDVFSDERSYPSIIEISTKSLEIPKNYFSKDDLEEDVLWGNLTNEATYKNKLKTAHKYIAIVQADGDNVGQLIRQVYETDSNLIEEFSKSLAEFSYDALGEIKEYGGETIYAGGDDLLFFAPVITKNKNIFQLLKKIDEKFNKCILNNAKLKTVIEALPKLKDVCNNPIKLPSMSYGLSITYYKYPMHEALAKARELLFNKAKSGSKNKIAYALQKHSGQTFEIEIEKGSNFYKKFIELLEGKDENLISSLLYNLDRQIFILEKIANDEKRLKNFFDNFYDEDIHKKNENKIFINKLKKMIYITYSETGNDIKLTLEKVYSALRFVKFINQKNNE